MFNGMFLLTDAWLESQSGRKVFKFRLELDESELNLEAVSDLTSEPTRVIPSEVKLRGLDARWREMRIVWVSRQPAL